MLCINGESIHSVYRKRFYDLLDTGKNCYYRMMSRRTMNWRSLLTCMVKHFCGIIREEDAVEKDVPSCYIIDDTTIEKTGNHIGQISKVFDHVKGKCVTGFKPLLLATLTDGQRYRATSRCIRKKANREPAVLTKRPSGNSFTRNVQWKLLQRSV